MLISDLIARVRFHLGDPAEGFRTNALGDGDTTWFDLPKQNISKNGFNVEIIHDVSVQTLIEGNDFTMDYALGQLTLFFPVQYGDTILVQGKAYALYTDDELEMFIDDAVTQHVAGRTITERFRDQHGFIKYRETPIDLINLPEIEEPMLALLATIEILWSLSTDASTDVDVVTAEGTHIARSQRWAQLRSQIDVLTEKYQQMCQQLNIGLSRIEILTLRRVSRTTNRLVPVFRPREYDDTQLPERELPPIGNRDPDSSGVPSPLWGPYGGTGGTR